MPEPDEAVARWAADRAASLLARAEEEAVAELRRALVEAALGRSAAPRPSARARPRPKAPEPPAPTGEALWAYCVAREASPLPEGVPGVDARSSVTTIAHAGLKALVSPVPLSEFGEEPLKANLNDLEWLERTARAHEAVLEQTLAADTIVPLRMCTIYDDSSRVREMLEGERPRLQAALERLAEREEWGVKLIVDFDRLRAMAAAEAGSVPETAGGAGSAYLDRRRVERVVRETADRLAAELVEDVHARLQDWASDAVVGRPQSRELSGYKGEMLLNAAYLVERERVERFHQLAEELADRHREVGARLDVTGPWPPYNFVADESSAVR